MSLLLDDEALALIEKAPATHGVLLTVVANYGMPGGLICAEWCPRNCDQGDPDVVFLETIRGRPFFVHRRLQLFVRFQPIRLQARGKLLWRSLGVKQAACLWREFSVWESRHPNFKATAVPILG